MNQRNDSDSDQERHPQRTMNPSEDKQLVRSPSWPQPLKEEEEEKVAAFGKEG